MEEEDKRVQDLREKYRNFNLNNNENDIEKENESKNNLEYQEFLEWKKEKETQGGENKIKIKFLKKKDLDKDKIVLKWFWVFIFVVVFNVLAGLFHELINLSDLTAFTVSIIQFVVNIGFLIYSTDILIDLKNNSQKSKYIKIFFVHIFMYPIYIIGSLGFDDNGDIGTAIWALIIVILLSISLISSWFRIWKQKTIKE